MNTVVSIDCELDAASVAGSMQFFERLAADPNDVVLDLRSVSAIDGSGLGALVHVYKRKRARGARLSLANVCGQPRQLLAELKVLALLECTGDEAPIDTGRRTALATSTLPNLSGHTAIPTR